MQTRKTTNDISIPKVQRRIPSVRPWGGFVLLRRDPQILHAKLTGRLSMKTLDDLDHRLDQVRSAGVTTFLVLDARHLGHLPLHVAREIVKREERWRSKGVVGVWIGVSRYVANLLLLASPTEEQLPAFDDLETLRTQIESLFTGPATVARGRLAMVGSLLH
jgi:hypothetical protein